MRLSIIRAAMVAMVLTAACIVIAPASAQSVMKVCGDEWKEAKAAGKTGGETWPQFLAQCRAQQKAGSAAAPAGLSGILVCGAIVTPMEGAYGNQERHPGRFAGGA